MAIRNVLLVAMLTASLCAAQKKPVVKHNWRTGTLVRIVPGKWDKYVSEAATLEIQGTDAEGNAGLWIAFLNVGPFLGVDRREPHIAVNASVRYAIEVVRCGLELEGTGVHDPDCGHTTDAFGKVTRNNNKTVLYLLDDDNHEFRLRQPQFRDQAPVQPTNNGGRLGPQNGDGTHLTDFNDPLRGLGPDKKRE